MSLSIEQSKLELSEYNGCLLGVVCPTQMFIDLRQGLLACANPCVLPVSQATPFLGMTENPSSSGSRSLDTFNSPAFIEKVKSGDDHAFRELVLGISPLLNKYVFDTFQNSRYPLSKSDIEEVVQDTMMRVGHSLRSGGYETRSKARFTSWIFKMAYNQACDRYKRIKRRNEVQLSSRGFDAEGRPSGDIKNKKRADGSIAIEDIAIPWSDPTERMHIEQVLQSLKETYREVLVLVYMDGHIPEEIAEREGVHVDAIYQRLTRARKRFRQAYAKL